MSGGGGGGRNRRERGRSLGGEHGMGGIDEWEMQNERNV